MAITRQTYRVWYEDESSQEVMVDQRDVAATERFLGVGVNKALPIAFMRTYAYFGLCRTNSLKVQGQTFAQWDKTVIEVEPTQEEEEVPPADAEGSSTGQFDSPSTQV